MITIPLNTINHIVYKGKHHVLFDNQYENGAFKHHPDEVDALYTIKNSINGGFPTGVNIGIKFAQTYLNTDYFWLLNNDAITNSSTLSELIKSSNQSTITGSTIISMDSKPLRSIGSITRLGLSKPYSNKYTSHYIPFTSALISKTIVNNVGLLNEGLFLYYDDADYCKQCTDQGYQLKLSHKSTIQHSEGASQKLDINKSACPDWLPIYSKKYFMKINNYPPFHYYKSLIICTKTSKKWRVGKCQKIMTLLVNEKKLLNTHHYYRNK